MRLGQTGTRMRASSSAAARNAAASPTMIAIDMHIMRRAPNDPMPHQS